MRITFMGKKGFTLLELIVVLAIVGIIVSIISLNYSNIRTQNIDDKRISDAQSIQIALEQYRIACKTYPESLLPDANRGPGGGVCQNTFGEFLRGVDVVDTSWYVYEPLTTTDGQFRNCDGYQIGVSVTIGGAAQRRSQSNPARFSSTIWRNCITGSATTNLQGDGYYHVWGPQ